MYHYLFSHGQEESLNITMTSQRAPQRPRLFSQMFRVCVCVCGGGGIKENNLIIWKNVS